MINNSDDLYYILHALNSTHNQGIANAIDNEKYKHRMYDEQRYTQMKKEIADEILSRLSVDVDVKKAILEIKDLKNELHSMQWQRVYCLRPGFAAATMYSQ